MSQPNPDRIAQIRKRLAESTPGPHRVQRYDNEGGEFAYQVETLRSDGGDIAFAYCSETTNLKYAKCNAELIANAPADLALLLKIVQVQGEALRQVISEKDEPDLLNDLCHARDRCREAIAAVAAMVEGSGE